MRTTGAQPTLVRRSTLDGVIRSAGVGEGGPITVRVPARVGLIGNPSDGYGGAVVAAVVDAWHARVTVRPRASGVRIVNADLRERNWPTGSILVADVSARRPDAPHAIVVAALSAVAEHPDGGLPSLDLEWTSDVPRSVGLAGSSAIAVAVIEAVVGFSGRSLDPRVVAALALAAEVEGMGIAAGWQDRIVQSHRRAVLVDAADMSALVEGRAVPSVGLLSRLELDAVVGWRSDDTESSGVYHGALRTRAASAGVSEGMAELAALARQAVDLTRPEQRAELRDLVDRSWRARDAVAPLRAAHRDLVETVRAAGVTATSPGSGGSVVALPASEAERDTTVAALTAAGAQRRHVRLR